MALLPLANSCYDGYYEGVSKKKLEPLLEEEAFLHLQRTADAYLQLTVDFLKSYGLSPTQYNVLRILRGAGEDGLPCREIGQRMITRDPDITRLLDRLETRGWAERERLKTDRRVVVTRITADGLRLIDSIDEPIRALHRERLGRMKAERLRKLIALLSEARGFTAGEG